eukprot:c9873_g1_i1 orf=146-469(+)
MAGAGEDKQALEINNSPEEDQKKVWNQLKGSSNTDSIFQVNTAPLKAWPELVGLSGEEAKSKILAENPDLNVLVVPEDSFMTMDFQLKRVRVFVDSNGQVSRAPKVG